MSTTTTPSIAETLTDDELEALLAKRKKAKEAETKRRREQYEAHRDEAVTTLCQQASALSDRLAFFNQQAYATLEDLGQRLAEYGELRGNSKGGFTVTSNDGRYRISYTYQTISDWDERADKAETLLKEVLGDTVKKRDADLHEVIMSLLERNTKGKLEYGRIARLFKYETKFNDARWTEALRLFKESYQVRGSKFYIEFFERTEHGSYEPIQLNFSRLAPVEATVDTADANA